MKVRLINVFIISSLCCFGLLSCNNDDDLPKKGTKEDTWYWGYFKGEVNGRSVSLENEDYNGPIHSGRSSYYFSGEWDVLPDSINIMGTLIHYNDSSELRIALYDLTPGERYLTLSENAYWHQSCINATVFSSSSQKTVKAKYTPSEKNPFRVKITDVLWLSLTEPVIEVELDGVLYNREDENDAIVIKGIYGTR